MLNILKKISFFLANKFKGILASVIIIFIFTSLSITSFALYDRVFRDQDVSEQDSGEVASVYSCNVLGLSLHGVIVTYNSPASFNESGKLAYDQTSSEEVLRSVNDIQDNDNIKAIVVEIDSSGGSGVAGEEIMRVFKESKKPVIAYIRKTGASAAYLAATGAQTIFASKLSDVGSIGVTMSYIQNTDKNRKDGLEYISLSSGKYKDSGSPDKPITDEEKQLFMRDVKIGSDYFINLVAQNRNLDIEKVRSLADGSTVMGESALKLGLIDKIGTISDVTNFVSEKIGEKADICF